MLCGDPEEGPVAQKILGCPDLYLTREYRVITPAAVFFSSKSQLRRIYSSSALNHKLYIAVLEVGLTLPL